MDLLKMQQNELEKIKMQQQMQMIEEQAKQFLDSNALSRFGNIKAADPEKAMQICMIIVNAFQNRQIKEKLNDEEFKNLLINLQGPKKEFRFMRK